MEFGGEILKALQGPFRHIRQREVDEGRARFCYYGWKVKAEKQEFVSLLVT
jgi:hypothetical protein